MIFLSARGVLANGHVLIGHLFEPACIHAVDHAKFKTTTIYSQGILVNYTKICTNENFPLYGVLSPPSPGAPLCDYGNMVQFSSLHNLGLPSLIVSECFDDLLSYIPSIEKKF